MESSISKKTNGITSNSETLLQSKDEVDFAVVGANHHHHHHNQHNTNNNNNNNNNNNINNNNNHNIKKLTESGTTSNGDVSISQLRVYVPKSQLPDVAVTTMQQQPQQQQQPSTAIWYNKNKTNNSTTGKSKADSNTINNGNGNLDSKKLSTLSKLDKLSFFAFSKKINQKSNFPLNGAAVEATTTTTTTISNKPSKVKTNKTNVTSQPSPQSPPPDEFIRQHKFVKSASFARLLSGSTTYNTKKFEKEEQRRRNGGDSKFNTFSGARRRSNGPYLERFKKCSKEDGDEVTADSDRPTTVTTKANCTFGGSLTSIDNYRGNNRADDLSSKAFRTISRGLGKLWWRKSHSVDISPPDPEFKVSYLGNVLTGWAKGDGCIEKQLNTLWRNYTQNNKPDVIMRIKVCASGLKATTRQHGLTEYWSNRITHCCAPKNYPRVFCWIYRHEGRKLKHELRCHAVLCSKEKIVQDICSTLKENLESALREFKREKLLKQNARLSLANAAYDNPSLPRRKILLCVGGNNYRPPLERSKSAPKLMAIEEDIGEEEGEDHEETNEPEMKPCCQKDSLYPAMTLGRRRCRRGHSIRRTGQSRPAFCAAFDATTTKTTLTTVKTTGVVVTSPAVMTNDNNSHSDSGSNNTKESSCHSSRATDMTVKQELHDDAETNRHSFGSDEDDFDKLLMYNNYDTGSSLAGELLPYFDMKMMHSSSLTELDKTNLVHSGGDVPDDNDDQEEDQSISFIPTVYSNPSAEPCSDFSLDATDIDHQGLRHANGICSDGDDYDDEEEEELEADHFYLRQANIINMLHRNSMRKMANLSMSSDESSIETTASSSTTPMTPTITNNYQVSSSSFSVQKPPTGGGNSSSGGVIGDSNRKQLSLDSDEGSISSGCETASTVTTNLDDVSLKYRSSTHSQSLQEAHSRGCGIQVQGRQNENAFASSSLSMDDETPNDAALAPSSAASDIIDCKAGRQTAIEDNEEYYQRHEGHHRHHGSEATTLFSKTSSLTLKLGSSPSLLLNGNSCRRNKKHCHGTRINNGQDSDSECSDESGYVEFQETKASSATASSVTANNSQHEQQRLTAISTTTAV